MKLYNTLSRKIEEFKPEGEIVKLYSCGPTVYDYPTIGNLRAYVFVDILRRALEESGYMVKHVMNITDVGHLASDADEGEDKLEKGAIREGKTVEEVAKYYSLIFKNNISQLNILPPNAYHDDETGDSYARATKFIAPQIDIVATLLKKDFAYITNQAIYFNVTKLPSYGDLTGQKLSEKETGARQEVVTDAAKVNPQDFALWFFTIGRFKDHSMRWGSPWGEGFPGWHLECSAIVHATLGEPLDIHTGGVDHIGTHHTNEMAQTEAAFGKKLSKHWMHNEFMLVNGKKMSKSLNNFYTLHDVIKKGYDPLALRLLFLQSHYRSQMNFTWDALAGAQNRLEVIRAFADLRFQAKAQPDYASINFEGVGRELKKHLQNDLNTPQALVTLNGIIDVVLKQGVPHKNLQDFESLLEDLDNMLGLGLSEREDITEHNKTLITEREVARNSQDWAKADEIRLKLTDSGLAIEDGPTGPIWSRLR